MLRTHSLGRWDATSRDGRLLVTCQSGKGFGSPKHPAAQTKKKKSKGGGGSKRSTQAEKAAETAMRTVDGPRGVPPVDPKEAAEGRLDFVTVEDWGSGSPSDVANLKVESFQQGVGMSESQPFYERLARELELLQAQGSLSIAEGEAMPPFKKWSFKEHRYCAYMCDQQHVHHALEAAVGKCIGPESGSAVNSSLSIVQHLLKTDGLARSQQFHLDLGAVLSTHSGAQAATPPSATPQATAYAQYLEQLSQDAMAAEEAEETDRLKCRLVANAYTIMVTHLTTGFRIGARATEGLGLIQRDATRAFQSYPEATPNPLETFVKGINQIGELLSSTEKEYLFGELASAFKKTALLLLVIAKED